MSIIYCYNTIARMDFVEFFINTEPREDLVEVLWLEAKDHNDWVENEKRIKEVGLSLGANVNLKDWR